MTPKVGFRSLASGDLHFVEDSRWKECLRIHAWIVEQCRELRPDVFIVPGDAFDQTTTPTVRAALADFAVAVSEWCPIVFVQGNHDPKGDLAMLSRLQSKHGIYVVESARVLHIGGAAIACVAWPDEAALLKALPAASLEEADQAARGALRSVFSGLGAELAQHNGPRIAAAHAMVDGSITGTGQPLIGHSMNVGLEDLALMGADITILGHVHKEQDWTFDGRPIAYTGSNHRRDFGESETKSIVCVDYQPDGRTMSWRRIETPSTPMVLLEARWNAGEDEEDWLNGDPHAVPAGAEVRIRYDVSPEHSELARASFEGIRDAMLQAGAASVKIEERVRSTSVARVPEVARATALDAKLEAMWTARDPNLDPDRRASMLAIARSIVDQEGRIVSGSSGAVRFESIRGKNVEPYAEIDVDFTKIQGPLIAVCGPNGSGKSTMLEMLPGAFYRTMPTRGDLIELATARDSMLEVTANIGRRVSVRHLMDNVSGKSKVLVRDDGGIGVPETPKVSDLDRWVAANVTPPGVLYAGPFSAQASGGFAKLEPKDRKAVVLRALRIEQLERYAKNAAEREKAQRKIVEDLRAKHSDEQTRGARAGELAAALGVAEAKAADMAARAAAARIALDRAREASKDAARAAEVKALRASVNTRVEEHRTGIATKQVLLGKFRGLVTHEAEIRGAAAKEADCVTRIADVDQKLVAVDALINSSATETHRLKTEIAAAERDEQACDLRIGRARQRLQDRIAVSEAVGQVRSLTDRIAEIEATERTEVEAIAAHQREHMGLAGARVLALRTVLVEVISAAESHESIARRGLEADDGLKTKGEQAPAELDRLQLALNATRAQLADARVKLLAAERLAARESEMKAAERELKEAEAARSSAAAAFEALREPAAAAERERAGHIEERDRLRAQRTSAVAERATAAEMAQWLPKLEAADERIKDLETQIAEAESLLARAEAELRELPDLDAPSVDLESLERAASEAGRAEREATESCGGARANLDAARAASARAEDLRGELDGAERLLVNLTRLATDLSRDGLQLLEIDAAIPELNTIANDLLASCFGSRFTVELHTTQLDAKGHKEVEGLYVRVYDSVKRKEKAFERLSGGQRVIVGEAIALALTTVACQRAGLERPSIVRDESGAALSKKNGRAYIAMLRRAAALIGADRVLYVSHTRELQELADGWIGVCDGVLRVLPECPTFEESDEHDSFKEAA